MQLIPDSDQNDRRTTNFRQSSAHRNRTDPRSTNYDDQTFAGKDPCLDKMVTFSMIS